MTATPSGLHVNEDFNPEEAAHAAAEFVASLDNLPGEVTFLLEEITEKDNRVAHLLSRINTRHYGLTKSSKALNAQGAEAEFPLPIPAGDPLPIAHLSTKDQQAMTKIQAEWGKIEALQEEKIQLGERLERIVNRARERGKAEWIRVGGMDLDQVEREEGRLGGFGLGEFGGGEVMLPPSGLGSGMDGKPYRKKKPNALPLPLPSSHHYQNGPIIHPPLPTGMLPPPTFTTHPPPSHHSHHSHHSSHPPHSGGGRASLSARSSRHGRRVSSSTLSEDPDGDAEAEGDEGGDDGMEGDTDNTLYCICQQKSYGEMIGCDNEDCEFEWFHVKCVNMTGPTPETWYCPDCVTKLGMISSDGRMPGGRDKKGRRK